MNSPRAAWGRALGKPRHLPWVTGGWLLRPLDLQCPVSVCLSARCKFFSLTETPEDYTIIVDEEGFLGKCFSREGFGWTLACSPLVSLPPLLAGSKVSRAFCSPRVLTHPLPLCSGDFSPRRGPRAERGPCSTHRS